MKRSLYILQFFLLIPLFLSAQPINQKHIAGNKLYYGAAYYPEVWNSSEIEKDIRHMKELNMNVMRMAEFSWALMEPEEGKYEFEWLHRIIEQLYDKGIEVILGTPTATPPVWMATKYPEIFRLDENGFRMEHGARRNCRYTSKVYQDFSVKICEAMAREFGKKPGVIAWQTDNEFGLSLDYSEETKALWHKWLNEKYKTIDQLNRIWHTNLWSQHYQVFDQIPMPKSQIWHHPSLRLDWTKFSEEQLLKYQDLQIKAIRKYSDLPITHDGMPGQQISYPKLFKDLDFACTNVYHSFQVYNRVQGNYDRLRGYHKGMHWLFETAPNHSGGGPKGNTWFIHQPDGALRAAIWMNYAMGGQGALFWLWRQQPAGQEMPHGAVLSAWGKPMANYRDLKTLGAELQDISDLLMNHPVKTAEVAIIYDHDAEKEFRIEEISNGINYYKTWTSNFYRPVSDAFIHRDVISLQNPLDDYKVLFIPLVPIVPSEDKERIKRWVEDGGTLVLGPMSAYRNDYFAANTDFALGDFENWMGIHVTTRLPIDPFTKNYDASLEVVMNDTFHVHQEEAQLWSDALVSENGRIMATYKNGMHDGKAAIVENTVGKGKVVLLGTYPGKNAMKQIVLHYSGEKGILPLGTGDENVLIVPRTNGEDEFLIIINLNNKRSSITLPQDQYLDVSSNNSGISNHLELKPFDVRCIAIKQGLKSRLD